MVVGRPLYNKQASELSTSSQPCELSTARMPKHARNERECPAFDSNFFAPFLLMTPHQWGREFYFFWHLVLQTALHQIHPSNHRQSLHHSWWGCFPASSPSSCKGLSDAAGQACLAWHSWPGAAGSCFWSLSAFVCCTSHTSNSHPSDSSFSVAMAARNSAPPKERQVFELHGSHGQFCIVKSSSKEHLLVV